MNIFMVSKTLLILWILPKIIVGNEHENPTYLNRNDAEGDRGIWEQENFYGKWSVKIEEGNYKVRFKFIKPLEANGRMYLQAGTIVNQKQNPVAIFCQYFP